HVKLTTDQIKQAGIEIDTPALRIIDQTVRVKGVIDAPPTHKVAVSVPMGGYLKVMRMVPGMKIAKGATLCEIEDARYVDLQQEYLVGKSKLVLLENDYSRQSDLRQSQSVSEKVYQQVQSDYTSQKAIVAGLAEKLRLIGIEPSRLSDKGISRRIVLRAPISGYVSKVNVNAGQYVDPTLILFEIINSADIHLSLTVFENDLSKLEIGQKVTCYTNSEPSVKYVARVSLINRSIDNDRASEVHCHLENQNKLVPGMFMNAEIHVRSGQVTSVPDEAIVRWENKLYIFVAEGDNRFNMIPVAAGPTTGGFTAINDDLSGKRIVTANAYSILMQLKNNADE
ncbi:MAG: efflux RND transporter periplasmic adaptor subunit, partial [Chitinophagaceae bacterium]